ncbi:Probable ribonuclease FitB [Nocardia otitidiscaviarum]|uniref:Ribonuclease VapC n=1 Tax=Nocardia otitidiscaviarum TaxID=1823 RepID=A0A378Y8L2_9NOCA|nr:PIN domain-containing protein [Nocardia otitidiscaviarum]MBF6241524.1 PIN domain-containing protein [Nocardia otitidiscaviarum]SUA72841.1 Probable ribonuclease FitB [Nocardia otitidiscaviarum]
MILLGTDVLVETMREDPNPSVVAWIDANPVRTLYISAITVAELRFGFVAISNAERARRISQRFETRILPLFSDRILPFDVTATNAYAEIMETARTTGTRLGPTGGCIAATAATSDMCIATGDPALRAIGVPVINPWK